MSVRGKPNHGHGAKAGGRAAADQFSWPPADEVRVIDLDEGPGNEPAPPPAKSNQAAPDATRDPQQDQRPPVPPAPTPTVRAPGSSHNSAAAQQQTSSDTTPAAAGRLASGGSQKGERQRAGARRVTIERVALLILAIVAVGEAVFLVLGYAGRTRADVPRGAPSSLAASGTTGRAQPSPATAEAGADLTVGTIPPGADVMLDGKPLGKSPVSLSALSAGEHTITVAAQGRTIQQRVTIAAGKSLSVMVPIPNAPSPASGSVTLRAPVEIQVFEGDRLIGTSEMADVRLSSGAHSLQLVNKSIGFSEKRSVRVQPGKRTTLDVKIPDGRLSVNAVPWAEVWVDGVHAGQTPIGGFTVKPGEHQVTLRHPQLGERTVTATVKVNEPALVSVRMQK